MLGILPLIWIIFSTLNQVLATNITCPNIVKSEGYSLCWESNGQSFMKAKQIPNSIADGSNNDKSTRNDISYHDNDKRLAAENIKHPIYCSPDIDVAIMDTSMGGDFADMVCESRSER
jgi:hypothetical protein